jgi:hypothetical protein
LSNEKAVPRWRSTFNGAIGTSVTVSHAPFNA